MLNMKTIFIVLLILLVIGSSELAAQVSPEILIGARGVMSLNLNKMSDEKSSAVSDFSDTSFLIGFRQKLYNQFRGKFVLGFQFPDADSDLGQIYFHQVFLQIEDKSNILKIGRSRVKSALIEFPTLRDDDALYYTDVLNPFSSGINTEESQFGNVLELTHIFNQRLWLRIHGEHFTETPELPETSETDFGLNSLGMSFEYLLPETQRWNRKVLNQIGISFNNFITDREGYTSFFDRALKNIILSTTLNIHPDPVHFWDVKHQTIYNNGFEEVTKIGSYLEMARAKSLAAYTSVRCLYRKLERPTVQISASLGYKTFPDLINNTNQLAVIANAFYRLGENFDVGVQFRQEWLKGDLENIFGKSNSQIQFSIIYSIDQSWNNQFDDRDSLLNLEHGYIK
jgi:hypothetical protein